MTPAAEPPLSIVVAVTLPWPAARDCLTALQPQVAALGAEVLVVDGCGRGVPEADDGVTAGVRRLAAPGASPYRLRAIGLTAARAAVVAVTEDHCRVRPDWCARVLAAHRERPEAAVIGGAVENGATARLIDWAAFLIANGSHMQPLPLGPRACVSGQANVSYKRRVLPAAFPDPGMVEARFHDAVRAAGGVVLCDPRVVVDHVQSLGLWGTCVLNYHNGRCMAGFERADLAPRARARRLARMLLWPLRVVKDTARIVLRTVLRKRRHRAVALASAPLIALVLCFHVAGEAMGYAAGPGDSPIHMH